jgi:DNA-directed RNA polymerase specialized sigma24 family protein
MFATFNALYERYRTQLVSYIQGRFGPSIAEDIAHETWVRILKRVGKFVERPFAVDIES